MKNQCCDSTTCRGQSLHQHKQTTDSSHKYSATELAKLRQIVLMVKEGANEEHMGHWGNHSDYTKGW